MQKRRVGGGTTAADRNYTTTLPLTEADTLSSSNNSTNNGIAHFKMNPKKRSNSSSSHGMKLFKIMGILLIMALVSLVVLRPTVRRTITMSQDVELNTSSMVVQSPPSPSQQQQEFPQEEQTPRKLPLSQFPTLQKALEESELVGVYFAAQWCPMSTPVTNQIAETFTDLSNMNGHSNKYEFSIVYVSSDRDETSMLEYSHGKGWTLVPFEDEERSQLKYHFQTCAQKEISMLKGIDRQHGIPTFVIVDGPTHGILTMQGADDLQHYGSSTLHHWQQIQQTRGGLEK